MVERPPAWSKTVRNGAFIAPARNENALIRLLFPEPLRPTKIVGLSKVMQIDGMLRNRSSTSRRMTGGSGETGRF